MKVLFFFLVVILFANFADPCSAQTKRKPRKTTAKVIQAKPQTQPEQEELPAKTETLPNAPAKKNERVESSNPVAEETSSPRDIPKKANPSNRQQPAKTTVLPMPFYYEFSQPQFYVGHVIIEHDTNGKGKITFERQDLTDPITDPLTISPVAIEKIKKLYSDLNFLESKETYQSPERNYAHLGNMKFRMQDNERKREVEFNWTENKTAEELANEYKKISEQFIWMFEINVARENQPLESPKLMDKLDSLVKRNLISDSQQILPILRDLANDERIPLIARHHAERIIKTIDKQSEKKSK